MGAPLSSELKKEYGFNSLRVRKGDVVRILRGDARGLEGKVVKVDLSQGRIQIEGITQKKVDGSTVFTPVHPSKVEITKLDLTDKLRSATAQRKKPPGKAKGAKK
jgi:large subunit ribosomal protein L24